MTQSINIKGTLVDLSSPKVMGIVNVTPDSFYDGGKTLSIDSALSQGLQMVKEGATFLDIGGYSSRPGAKEISVQEEMDRVLPVIEALHSRTEVYLSVDTFRADVAKAAIKAGAHIVNDISAGEDDIDMLKSVGELKVPYIAMHKQGRSATMQDNPTYNNVVLDVFDYLVDVRQRCLDEGILDVIVDPGFGFGKTLEHNYELLNGLATLNELNLPVLVGLSRKSMVYKALSLEPEDALNGTTFLHGIALQKGASILRVHDVKEAVECVHLFQHLKKS